MSHNTRTRPKFIITDDDEMDEYDQSVNQHLQLRQRHRVHPQQSPFYPQSGSQYRPQQRRSGSAYYDPIAASAALGDDDDDDDDERRSKIQDILHWLHHRHHSENR